MRILLVLLVVTGALLICSPAFASIEAIDAVNDKKRVVVHADTKYRLAFRYAAGHWNRFYYRSEGKGPAFVWARTTKQPVTLKVRDFHDCQNPAGAHYDFGDKVRVLRINRCHMDEQPFKTRQLTIGHELGHALGFGHTPMTGYYWYASIMYPTNYQPSAVPRAHDWQMYQKRWLN